MKSQAKPKIMLTLGGGGYGRECDLIVADLRTHADLLYSIPSHIRFDDKKYPPGHILKLPELQTISYGSKLTTIRSGLLIFLESIKFLRMHRPDCVAGITMRESIFILAAARILGINTVFIESITRVDTPSLTLRLISKLRLARSIYVQWPELAEKVKNAEFKGRLL